MQTLQELLNQEAKLSNDGHSDSDFRKIIHEEIKSRRGSDAPPCWGQDDCSTNILMRCPWRIDCSADDQ